MDSTTFWIIILLILVALIAFGIWLFRRGNVNAEVQGPAGTGARFSGRQPDPPPLDRPAIEAGNVTAVKGSATVRDETEKGIKTKDVTGTDVTIEAKARPAAPDPKEQPPT